MRIELHHGVLSRRTLPGVVASSALVVAGCAGTFWIAARVTGVVAPPAIVLPLVLVVLLAMAVPLNVAGWGPREGVAAWAFAAAGLGAAQGVTASVAYGVLVFVAALPGAAVLLTDRLRPAARTGHD
jgi:glycosyltransferase 2 family protein